MSKIRDDIENDQLYQWSLSKIPDEERELVMKENERLIANIERAVFRLQDSIQTKAGFEALFDDLGESLAKGEFDGIEGVSPILWPKQDKP